MKCFFLADLILLILSSTAVPTLAKTGLNDAQCGIVSNDRVKREVKTRIDLIIGGRHSLKGEYPWHIGIYDKDANVKKIVCGGSLISSTVVLTGKISKN